MECSTWNLQGKSLGRLGDWASSVGFCSEVLFLQEVGGLGVLESTTSVGSLQQFHLPPESDLHDELVLGTSDTQSYLGQVIVLDHAFVDSLVCTYHGTRWIAARFVDARQQERVVIGIHFPHRDNSVQYYEDCLYELEQFISNMGARTPCIIGGDWNAEPGDDRFAMLEASLGPKGFTRFGSDKPTWHGRFTHSNLDYFYVNMHELKRPSSHAEPDIKHDEEAAGALQCDHDILSLSLYCIHHHSKSKRKPRKRNRCRKWAVSSEALAARDIDPAWFAGKNSAEQSEILKNLASSCSVPRPSFKYKDPESIKQLCRQRHLTSDPSLRQQLSQQILSQRREAREEWLRDLMRRAASGDYGAIGYLKQRSQPKVSYDRFFQDNGGKAKATSAVQSRAKHLFEADQQEVDCTNAWAAKLHARALAGSPAPVPFTQCEVRRAVDKLKRGKTSGMSGVSAEFVKALASDDEGMQVLTAHLNGLLLSGDIPSDYNEAFVTFIAKCQHVSRPKDLRPINLLETINKVFMSMLTHRLQQSVPTYPCQHAGRPGHQTLDALSAAFNMVDRESKWGRHSIWISLDVSAAFDSIRCSQVAEFLHQEVGLEHGWEALRMLEWMRNPGLSFQFMADAWHIRQSSGVQQGGSHSSWIFSCVLARRIEELFQSWTDRCPPSLHGTYGLLYIDDILICLPCWQHASDMYRELEQTLADLGLQINVEKTHLMCTASQLAAGRDSLHEDSPLRSLTWDISLRYLRRRLTHGDHSSSLLRQAQQCLHGAQQEMQTFLKHVSWHCVVDALHLLNIYIASTWLWFSPLVHPLVQHTEQIDTWQATYTIQALKLAVPEGLHTSLALSLLRVRRRAIRVTILSDHRWRWVSAWVRRKWKYLGHLLRRGADNIPTKAMLACKGEQRIGSPWSSSVHWLRKLVCDVYCLDTTPSDQCMIDKAADRATWQSHADAVVHRYAGMYRFAHTGSFHSVRKLFGAHVPWLMPIFLQLTSHGWALHVLDQTEGWQYVTVKGHCPQPQQWECALVRLTMLWSPWVLQLCLSSEVEAIFSGACSPLQSLMWQQHRQALLCEYVDERQYSVLEQMVQ
eukprot:s5109_g4.t1